MFDIATHGTVFLEHIHLLPERAQDGLLKVLEAAAEPQVNVRVIAATDTDLKRVTEVGSFRMDLYFRLNVGALGMPPLRERGADAVMLAEHFLAEVIARCRLARKRLAADARAAVMGYQWPGNLDELRSRVERAALSTDEPDITAQTLGIPIR